MHLSQMIPVKTYAILLANTSNLTSHQLMKNFVLLSGKYKHTDIQQLVQSEAVHADLVSLNQYQRTSFSHDQIAIMMILKPEKQLLKSSAKLRSVCNKTIRTMTCLVFLTFVKRVKLALMYTTKH
ncbi:hypothetical protein DPMN_173777 [Dreissena polymorpha]|uniref:Uncharacterized protein n=1 Tax=Dreissena polymorpha TaxID=45954 RepID=A0A9D4E593_DREPO|nr:hypothetical protein DPMN_173777 [Dreissena polymorpha]